MAYTDKGRLAGTANEPMKRSVFSQGPPSHVKKKPTRQPLEGEETFTIADVESMGFIGVKKFASDGGFLKEGRYTIPGRAKIKRMNYIDREGLEKVLLFFRAKQGTAVLKSVEKTLAKMGANRERALKKVRALIPEKCE